MIRNAAGDHSRQVRPADTPAPDGRFGTIRNLLGRMNAVSPWVWTGLAVVLAVRMVPVLVAGFPIGDGGLFAAMAGDIRRADFGLPLVSSFNDAHIPFVYPPLGLYILAAIPGDPIAAERWLPVVWSLTAVGAAWLFAREITTARTAAFATIFFAAMPITWAIEGGGVTRGLGFTLLLLTCWCAAVTTRQQSFVRGAATGVVAALAVLSHPAVGPALVSLVALLLVFRWSAGGARALAFAAVVGGIAAAPWFWLVVTRHGIGPLLAGAIAHDQAPAILRLIAFGPTWLGPLDVTLVAAMVGLAAVIRRRSWLIPAWIIALLIVPSGEGRYSALAWALLAAEGVVAIAPLVTESRVRRLGAVLGVGALVLASYLAGIQRFRALPAEIQMAMAQVAQITPAGSTFAVRTGALDERVLDWFPVLAQRVSIGTYMGLEWTSPARWHEGRRINAAVQQGLIPDGTDYVFVVSGRGATIEPRT